MVMMQTNLGHLVYKYGRTASVEKKVQDFDSSQSDGKRTINVRIMRHHDTTWTKPKSISPYYFEP